MVKSVERVLKWIEKGRKRIGPDYPSDITKHKNYPLLGDYDKKNNFDIEKEMNSNLRFRKNQMIDIIEMKVWMVRLDYIIWCKNVTIDLLKDIYIFICECVDFQWKYGFVENKVLEGGGRWQKLKVGEMTLKF